METEKEHFICAGCGTICFADTEDEYFIEDDNWMGKSYCYGCYLIVLQQYLQEA